MLTLLLKPILMQRSTSEYKHKFFLSTFLQLTVLAPELLRCRVQLAGFPYRKAGAPH